MKLFPCKLMNFADFLLLFTKAGRSYQALSTEFDRDISK